MAMSRITKPCALTLIAFPLVPWKSIPPDAVSAVVNPQLFQEINWTSFVLIFIEEVVLQKWLDGKNTMPPDEGNESTAF
jgi:hypothetical protein